MNYPAQVKSIAEPEQRPVCLTARFASDDALFDFAALRAAPLRALAS